MKNPPRLPVVVILLAALTCAQIALHSAHAEPEEGKPDATVKLTAQDELRRARQLLQENESVRARIVETVSILDRSFKAEGRYLQGSLKGNDRRMRLEMTLKVGKTEGTLLEVCDGQVLVSRHEIGDQPFYSRRNVTEIVEAAKKKGDVGENAIIADLGLGGLPALLASLDRTMDFNGVKRATLRDKPVYVIQGKWKQALQDRWQAQPPANTTPGQLPPHIPDTVQVSIDRETGFPYRLQYLKRIPNRDVFRPILTLDFLDVKLNETLNPNEFVYTPPDQHSPQEVTPNYLNQLQGPPPPPPLPGPPLPPPAGK